jgi:2-hydroxycyclohexanecarboxyl-CoA dehydrogenase
VSDVSGKPVAVVVGVTNPIGEAVSLRLSEEGYLVAEIDPQAGTGEGDLTIVVDVADRAQMKAAAQRVVRELGPISVLVTAPGYHDMADFGEMSDARWQRLLQANLGATTSACAAVVPVMVEAQRGTVVTITTFLALAGEPGETYYAAATGGILAFTKSFALEVARHGVRVNCIAVGNRGGVQPEEIAGTVMFLVRDGDFFVGQVLRPGGGADVF